MSHSPNHLLVLDVDGVINALSPSLPTGLQYSPYRAVDVEAEQNPGVYRIHYSPQVVNDINHLSNHVTIVYLTTWEADTQHLAAQVGLNHFPYLPLEMEKTIQYEEPFTTQKGNALRKYLHSNPEHFTPGSSIVWVDDQITPRESTWAKRHGIIPHTPNPVIGLLKKEMRRVYDAFNVPYPETA